MPKEPGAINGSMMKRQRPIISPVITIGVQDFEDTMKRVKKIGGEIIKGKVQVGGYGFCSLFQRYGRRYDRALADNRMKDFGMLQ